MSYYLGAMSRSNLQGVHPDVTEAVYRAISYTTQDFGILDGGGLRTPLQANENALNGTGITNSLHLPQADGYSWAVDLVAYRNGKYTYGDNHKDKLALYLPIRKAMLRACDEIKLLIQHGADWDLDGILEEPGEWDWAHFQKPVLPMRIEQARIAMIERRLTLCA